MEQTEKIRHPSMIMLEITTKCNMECVYCYCPSLETSKVEDLTLEQIRDIVLPQVEETNASTLCIIGGEPTVRSKDLIKLAPAINRINCLKDVMICTNGYLLDSKMHDEIVSAFKGKRVYFSISLDSLDPILVGELRPTKQGMTEGVLERTMAAIKMLRKKRAIFTIDTVVTTKNFDGLEKLIQFVRSLGRRVAMEILPFKPLGRGAREEMADLILSDKQMQELDELRLRYLGDPILPWDNVPSPYSIDTIKKIWPLIETYNVVSLGCHAARQTLVVTASGDIIPCNYLRQEEHVLGNVLQTTLMKVYEEHPLALKLRAREIHGKCGNCKHSIICGGCRSRALFETGDLFGGIPSCQSSIDGHVHQDMANRNLERSGKKFIQEIKIFEFFNKLKRS